MWVVQPLGTGGSHNGNLVSLTLTLELLMNHVAQVRLCDLLVDSGNDWNGLCFRTSSIPSDLRVARSF